MIVVDSIKDSHYCLQIKQPQWILSHPTNDNVISISYNYHAATDVGMFGKMCLFVHLCLPVYACSFLFECFVGLYAGHPYIHLISFEIFLLSCLCTFHKLLFSSSPTHLTRAPPTPTKKPVASNSRVSILYTTEQATELCDQQQSCVTSSRVQHVRLRYHPKLPSWSHDVRAISNNKMASHI